MAKWFINMKKADFNGIARKYGVSTVIARIMRNREVRTDEEINLYLNGTPEDLYDGRLMKDMECAVSILKEKIAEEKKIRIIGDYDIDGVNSTYILQKGLELAGADVDTDIPHRIKDGYGLNRALVDRAYQDGVDTILTCDNGIAAIEEIAYGKEKGPLLTDDPDHCGPCARLSAGVPARPHSGRAHHAHDRPAQGRNLLPRGGIHEPSERLYGPVLARTGGLYARRRICVCRHQHFKRHPLDRVSVL